MMMRPVASTAQSIQLYVSIPHTCYPDESRSNGTSVIKEIRLKNLTPRIPPFKVTQCHLELSRIDPTPIMTSY